MLEQLDSLADIPLGLDLLPISLGGSGVWKAKSPKIAVHGALLWVLRLVVNGIPLNACLLPMLLDCLELSSPPQTSSFRLLSRRGWLISIAD